MVELVLVPHVATATLDSKNWISVKSKQFGDGAVVFRCICNTKYEDNGCLYSTKINTDMSAIELGLHILAVRGVNKFHVCMEKETYFLFMLQIMNCYIYSPNS